MNRFPFRNEPISITLVDPNKAQPNQFIVLADWSKLITKPYIPLAGSFQQLIDNNITDIHGVVLIGDLGYDLETNECANYLGFLEMLEQVAIYWPVISITGNHEYNSKSNWKLYADSFQLFHLADSARKIQSYYFKWFTLMTFDPIGQIYGTATSDETATFLQQI